MQVRALLDGEAARSGEIAVAAHQHHVVLLLLIARLVVDGQIVEDIDGLRIIAREGLDVGCEAAPRRLIGGQGALWHIDVGGGVGAEEDGWHGVPLAVDAVFGRHGGAYDDAVGLGIVVQ